VSTAIIKLEVRIIDLESLIEAARGRDHLDEIDLGEVVRIIPDDDAAAALKAMFHSHPPLPGCEIVRISCHALTD